MFFLIRKVACLLFYRCNTSPYDYYQAILYLDRICSCMKTVVHDVCPVCGREADFIHCDNAVLLRDAQCEHCGSSIRNGDVMRTVIISLLGSVD